MNICFILSPERTWQSCPCPRWVTPESMRPATQWRQVSCTHHMWYLACPETDLTIPWGCSSSMAGVQGHGKITLTFPLRSELGAYIGLLEGGETASTGSLAQSQGGSMGTWESLHSPGKHSLAWWNVTLNEKKHHNRSKIPRRKKNTCINISVLSKHIYLYLLIDVLLTYKVVLVSAIQRSESVIQAPFFSLLCLTGYYKILNIFPSATL